MAFPCLPGRSLDPRYSKSFRTYRLLPIWYQLGHIYLFLARLWLYLIFHNIVRLFFTSITFARHHVLCQYFPDNHLLKTKHRRWLFKKGFSGSPGQYSSVLRNIFKMIRKVWPPHFIPSQTMLKYKVYRQKHLTGKNTGDIEETTRKQLWSMKTWLGKLWQTDEVSTDYSP